MNYGGHAARGGRHTLREIWHSSNTTMEFPEWVLSLEDQVDLNNSIAGSHYTTDPGQYYDSATHQWHPYGPAYQATPVTTAPYVLTPQAIPTSAPTTAPPTAPPHVITPATLTPTAPAPVPPTAHAPAPPSATVMNSSPAAAKARPALPDASAPTATAPTTTAATTTAAPAPAHAPSTTPLTPAPPAYPPPSREPAPWRATGTAQIAAIRKELNDALLEFSQLKTEYTEQEAQLATEQHSYNQESAAFMQEMEMCHNEQSQYHECQSELRNFQRLFRIDAVNDKTWPMIKNWQAWMGHLSSEFSHKLKKEHKEWILPRSRAAPQNQFFHCWHCGLKCYLSMSCMNYKCSMNKIMEQERKLQEENTMRLIKRGADRSTSRSTSSTQPSHCTQQRSHQQAERGSASSRGNKHKARFIYEKPLRPETAYGDRSARIQQAHC